MALGDFSDQAESYRLARPTYAQDLVDQLIADAGIKPGDPVVDFGAGTGIFTRLLVDRGFEVTAIEPNEKMQSLHDVPEAHWRNATFEQSGLESNSQRWAVAAQAFHWADPLKALPEIHRVLEPDCLFTVIWNNRATQESELLSWTEQAIKRHVPEFDEAYRERPWPTILESTGDFAFAIHRSTTHVVRMSKQRFLELWKSHNRLNMIAGKDRFSVLLNEIARHLEELHLEEIDVPYHCESWSVRRK